MTISLSRYVTIVSGVGAGAAVAQRELIGRLFNDNPLIPANAVLEFTTPDNVGNYFGFGSPEYLRAKFYFGFVSKTISAPKKLSFARYAKAIAPARIYGGAAIATLAALQAINAGTLGLTVGGQAINLVGIDLTATVSYATVAAAIQAAIRAAAGSQYAAATVVYDAGGHRFNFTATVAGAAAVLAPTGTLAPLLGWTDTDAILSPGVDVQTIDAALAASAAISTNFGSFAFIPVLVLNEVIAAATWNAAANISYMFCCPFVDDATGEAIYAAITALAGTALTYAPTVGEYDEMAPMMLLAATDYTRRNAVQNYMYQSFGLTPKVDSDTHADTLDAIRANYYGVTQEAGQKISFYQRGVMLGGPTAPADQNVYANESWLKSRAASAIMTALLALAEIPANAAGRGQLLAILQGPIQDALFNGTISVGKTLSIVQQLAVSNFTGDPTAWRQVQAIGYWVDVAIVPTVGAGGETEYVAEYTLVYSKDDTIRKVDGTHVLI